MKRTLRLAALLLYSVSPGLAKLSGIDALFGVGLAWLVVYFALVTPSRATASNAAQWRVRAAWLAFVAYGLALGIALWLAGALIERSLVVGIAIFLVPLACVALAGPGRCARLLDDLLFVAVLHAVVALVIYPPLRPDIGWLHEAADTVLEGTLAFRLASVSGSLAMSSVMVTAFAVALRHHLDATRGAWARRGSWAAACLFLLCAFLSLQRAAWIALLLILALAAVAGPVRARGGLAAMLVLALAPLVAVALWIDIPYEAIEVLLERLDTLRGEGEIGAVAERSDQWLNVLHNFRQLPLGFGPGQLGQAMREARPLESGLPIYDGDYFRIVSEYGVMGAALTVLVIAGALAAARTLWHTLLGRAALGDGLLSIAAIGLTLQGIGTNVTELYFANTLFWALQLLQWRSPARAPRPQPVHAAA